MVWFWQDPSLHRDLHIRAESRYHVAIEASGKDGTSRISYDLTVRPGALDAKSGQLTVTWILSHVNRSLSDGTVSRDQHGAGSFRFGASGFAPDIGFAGESGVNWLPAIVWELPSGAFPGKHFEFKKESVAAGLWFDGAGYVSRFAADSTRLEWKGSLYGESGPIGRFTVESRLHPATGWPIAGKGSFIAPDGSVTFTVSSEDR